MLEHVFNCHGEWNALFALAGSAPFVGMWIKSKLNGEKNTNESR